MTEPSTETASAPQWPQLTGQAVSDFFGKSPRWLSKLQEDGFVERLPNRLYDAGAVALGYIRWLQDADRRSSKTEQGKLKEAEQVEKLRIENARARHELVDFDTIACFFTETFTTLRNELDGIPAGATRDLELREKITSLLNGALERCRARFEANEQALRSGQILLDPVEEGSA